MLPHPLSIQSASNHLITTSSPLNHPIFKLSTPPIRTVTLSEQKYTTAAMVLAFDTDPVIRWLYPDPHQYLTHFPELIRVIGREAYAHQCAYAIDGYAGAAFWFPPGIEPDWDARLDLFQRSVFEAQQPDLWALLEQLQPYRRQNSCWHLSLLAIEPIYQRQGYGSALLQAGLAQCDRDRLPAYVEASRSSHLSFYKRYGFECTAALQVGNSPTVFPMMRMPQCLR